ncbi:MAG: calcium-binding protein [Acaryochloridaceae cyanobacterium RL_2_7]|nr:calcium-binding protein [Acaryochloridaceae cyanobacterium RL_2_7]
MAIIIGTSDSDLLNGTAENDELFGLEGNDTLVASLGDDTLNGGAGSNTADYSALDSAITIGPRGSVFKSGDGSTDQLVNISTIVGAVGQRNTIDVSNNSPNTSIFVDLSTNQLNVLGVPSILPDQSEAVALPIDRFLSFRVENFVNANGTNNNDTLIGNNADNQLSGQGGNDRLVGSRGNDTLDGGTGSDIADYSGLNSAITLEREGIVRKGSNGTDQIQNIETIIGAEGQKNTINGRSSGITSFDINLTEDRLTVVGIPGLGDLDFNIQNFVNVHGTSRDDTIVGDDGDNKFLGLQGNDFLVGGAGNDTLQGGTGNDTLIGVDLSNPNSGPQIDTLNGGFGSDVFVLGTADEVFYNDHGRQDFAKITRFSTNFDKIQLSGSIDDYSFSNDGRKILNAKPTT